jgi:hypothetical protein
MSFGGVPPLSHSPTCSSVDGSHSAGILPTAEFLNSWPASERRRPRSSTPRRRRSCSSPALMRCCFAINTSVCSIERSTVESTSGTQESDRAASLAAAEIEIRTGAVLVSGSCTEHQAVGALPQPTPTVNPASNHLVDVLVPEKIAPTALLTAQERTSSYLLFQSYPSTWRVTEIERSDQVLRSSAPADGPPDRRTA